MDLERSPERDAALDALLAVLPFPGWTFAALCAAAGPDADLLFPGGPVDMAEAYSDLADRRMADGLPADGRLSARVRAVIAARLAQSGPHKEAVRRAIAIVATRPGAAAATLARTADAIWHAAGDRSADFSWYTKRGILAGVYASTILYWLRDDGADDEETLAFLDRRLAGTGRIGRLRRRAEQLVSRGRPVPPS